MAGVPAILLQQLVAARGQGESFDEAWPGAQAGALETAGTAGERREWADAFLATLESWRAAFERQQAPRYERALHTVAQDPDRVPVPDRECGHCGGAIPDGRGRNGPAKFCSEDCRRASHRDRERAAA